LDNLSDEKSEVLEVAERMFLERGYAATKLRDLAAQLEMKPASLYYHAPGGKEQLWEMVIERVLQRHHTNIVSAVQQAGSDLRKQLYAVADWLLSQPPVSMLSFHPIPKAGTSSQEIPMSERYYQAVMEPITQVFKSAIHQGLIRQVETDLLAGALVVSISGLIPLSQNNQLPRPAKELSYQLVDIFLDGLLVK
jgi:AcrR family transcriptional regulator